MDRIYNIDEMPSLKERLGKARTDRVRHYERESGKEPQSKRGKNVKNTVLAEMQGRKPSDPFCGVSDVIAGVARLDHHNQGHRNIPLSMNRMYTILQVMENITTEGVMRTLSLGERQAQKYVRACEITIPFLEEYFEEVGDEVVVDPFDVFAH